MEGPRPRGFALLIVLWTVGLLALLGSHITATSRQATAQSLLLQRAAEAEALADGLVDEAIFRLLDPSARGWKADGVPRAVRLGGGAGEVVVLDHAGRVNPALAPPPVLAALLRHDGMDEAHAARLAAAIVDWGTVGNVPSPGGAKMAQYRAAGLPYGPPSEAFRSPEELGLVLGMTPDVLARLQPHVSVWSSGQINLGRADPVVVQAVQEASDGPGGPGGPGGRPGGPLTQAGVAWPVVEIIARVTLREAQAIRRAVVRFDPGEAGAVRPWHILAWN